MIDRNDYNKCIEFGVIQNTNTGHAQTQLL